MACIHRVRNGVFRSEKVQGLEAAKNGDGVGFGTAIDSQAPNVDEANEFSGHSEQRFL